jgi:hypothetical protein
MQYTTDMSAMQTKKGGIFKNIKKEEKSLFYGQNRG